MILGMRPEAMTIVCLAVSDASVALMVLGLEPEPAVILALSLMTYNAVIGAHHHA